MKFNALFKRRQFAHAANLILLIVNLILKGIKETDQRRIIMRINLTIILLTTMLLQVSAGGYAQNITLAKTNAPLQDVIKEIRKQSGYDFVYTNPQMKQARAVTINVSEKPLTEVLQLCFQNQPFTYSIEDKTIIVKNKLVQVQVLEQLQQQIILGLVLDEHNEPIPGASIKIKGNPARSAVSNKLGRFSLTPTSDNDIIVVSYIGYTTQEIKIKGSKSPLTIKLVPSETVMKDVVVTGMMVRKKDSFTGATASFSGEDLKMIGNQNIIQSLKTLDPSFIQMENNAMGSNPNMLPTIELRGQTSITSTSTLRDQFSTDPNQPLFILDGFETTLRTIVDLDMNTVASITILKDAASTAIYGSRASNGVIVVETKKPVPGKLRLSYTSDLSVEMPDLSSYNMMNATEKLQFEKLAGRYTERNNIVEKQVVLDSIYNTRLKEVLRGVDTYWLSQPLQTGFSQRHSVSASGGDNALRYDIGANIKNNQATMIGSNRKDWGANINLIYRSGIFNISNRVYVSGASSAESPYGSFSDWVKTNPYYRLMDGSQQYLEVVVSPSIYASGLDGLGNERIPNPFYNASLTSFNKTTSFNILDNFQVSADLSSELRLQLNAQINKTGNEATNFTSPLNTMYASVEDPTLRGSYTFGKTAGLSYNVNASLTYAKVLAKKHSITTYLRAEMNQSNNSFNGYTAVGFPNASNGNPAFAYGFKSGDTPSAANSLTRRNSMVASLNYSYDQRFNVDLNFNVDGSTAFGSKHRYAPYYSGGLSWNVHKEHFMENVDWVNNLRLRGNIGITGNQNFGSVSQSVYNYYKTINSFGQGVFLSALGAEDLKWQKTEQISLGIDASLLKNRMNVQINTYRKYTDPLVVAITLPSSTGLSNYPFNAGALTVKGLETTVSFSPIYQPGKLVWTIGATGATTTSKYRKFDNQLAGLNTQLRNSNSLTRYRDGYSSYDLWAVPSLGIDPTTGQEVFLKKSGQQTFTYDVNDQVVVGSSNPKAQGVFSTTVFYKGFTAGVYVRYIFGRDQFNTALYNKVENISYEALRFNQDKRALYDRWQSPGDVTEFKNISVSSTTPISSRFVQKENSFSGESINMGYEFKNKKWLDKILLSNLSLNAYSNDLFYASTIKRERGTDYPYARSVSMSIRATFK
jgi:TonB-linked SusC/RagA family outer membrane protein